MAVIDSFRMWHWLLLIGAFLSTTVQCQEANADLGSSSVLDTSLFDTSTGEGVKTEDSKEGKELTSFVPFNPWMNTIRGLLASQNGK